MTRRSALLSVRKSNLIATAEFRSKNYSAHLTQLLKLLIDDRFGAAPSNQKVCVPMARFKARRQTDSPCDSGRK